MNKKGFAHPLRNQGAPRSGGPTQSNRADLFSIGVLLTHENKQVKFYDDLIKGKQVIVNFMYLLHGRLPDGHGEVGSSPQGDEG